MKVKDFIEKLDKFYKNKETISLAGALIIHLIAEDMKYDEVFLRYALNKVKAIEEKIVKTIEIEENFKKYVKVEMVVDKDLSIKEGGTFTFLKEEGTILFFVSNEIIEEIKKVLIKEGYTNEEGFKKSLENNFLKLILLFVREVKTDLIKKINFLNNQISKKEVEKIKNILI